MADRAVADGQPGEDAPEGAPQPERWQLPEHRPRLVATIRSTARWRRTKAQEFADDSEARKNSMRAATALRVLANFVETLPDDDLRLRCMGASRIHRDGETYHLSREAPEILSRFGIGRDAWQSGGTLSEAQMTNILNRVEGAEARARHAMRERASAGYGDA